MAHRAYARHLRPIPEAPEEPERTADFFWAEREADVRCESGKQYQKFEHADNHNQWVQMFEEVSRKFRLLKPVLSLFWAGGSHAIKTSPSVTHGDQKNAVVRFRTGVTFCGLVFNMAEANIVAIPVDKVGCPHCREAVPKARS